MIMFKYDHRYKMYVWSCGEDSIDINAIDPSGEFTSEAFVARTRGFFPLLIDVHGKINCGKRVSAKVQNDLYFKLLPVFHEKNLVS